MILKKNRQRCGIVVDDRHAVIVEKEGRRRAVLRRLQADIRRGDR